MQIYLAGKMYRDETKDWRQTLATRRIPGADAATASDLIEGQTWPVYENILKGGHDMTGPYRVEDWIHGFGLDGPHQYGNLAGYANYGGDGVLENSAHLPWEKQQKSITKACQSAIAQSNCMFVWLDDLTAYGTLFEMGWAAAQNIPIWAGVKGKPFDYQRYERYEIEPRGHGDCDEDGYRMVNLGSIAQEVWFPLSYCWQYVITESALDAWNAVLKSPVFHALNWRCRAEDRVSLTESPIEKACAEELIRQYNYNWIPQYQIGVYRADFAWPDVKLIVELDGHEYHSTKEQRQRDAARDRFLSTQGFTVLRFTGTEVHRNVSRVAKEINAQIAINRQKAVASK